MKRLGKFITVSIFLMAAFGVVFAPQKVSAELSASDLQTLQNESSRYLVTPPLFDQAVQRYLLEKTFTLEELKVVATIEERIETTMGGPEGTTPIISTENTVTALSPSFEATVNSFINYYKNEVLPREFAIRDPLAVENFSLKDFKSYLQGKRSSKNLTESIAAAYILDILKKRQTYVAGELTEESYENTSPDIMSGVEVTGTQITRAGELGVNPTGASPRESSKACSGFFKWTLIDCIDIGFAWLIKNTLLRLAGVFLDIAATVLNFSIKVGILDFAKWAPESLYPVWIVIRQILSLLIVFAGLYLGFMYILGKSEVFEKYIPWVIVFALFVNFSYPITRAMIDVSNIVSLKIYVAAVGEEALTEGSSGSNTAGAKIRASLGLTSLLDSVTASTDGTEPSASSINSTPSALLAVAMVLYAAYIFFNAAFIIIGRTATLIFITVASPLLLVDSVFPKLDEAAKKLRALFLEQLAVAPIFMIMLALTLKFLEIFNNGPFKASQGDRTTTFFNLTIMLTMLYIMNKVTKSVSGEIGKLMTGAAGKVGGLGLGLVTGGAGFAARSTIGRAAAAARDSKWVSNNRDGFLGRRAYSMTNSLAKNSYDVRNNSFVSGKMDKIGMGMGMGSKTNYEQTQERLQKERGGGLETAGRHTRNVYDENGELKHRKGDLDTSAEGVAARARYINSAGGLNGGVRSLFTSKQTQLDTRQQLIEANKELERAQKDKLVTDYLNFEDTDIGRKRKKDFFDRQKDEDRARLTAADKKKTMADYGAFDDSDEGRAAKKAYLERVDGNTGQKVLSEDTIAKLIESDRKKALAEYKTFDDTQQGRKEKEEFYKRQDEETRGRLDEHDETKKADKEDKERKEKEILETNKRIAEAQEQLVTLLGGQKGGSGSVPPPQSGTSEGATRPTSPTSSPGGASAAPVSDNQSTQTQQAPQTSWAGQGNTAVPAADRKAAHEGTSQNQATPQRQSASTPQTPEQVRVEKQRAATAAIHKEYDEEITF